ncbi:hypothetical protein SAMN06264364_13237 [Quadrisphaera granulorum]|uniref:Uncharacterized protein n=1 Tax=Quadrisphaera granulorum TaxID=317664 RepID=A0A316AEF6_9ACTN|nr:hypothetical protein [Quadrisphaera granulorum]PWJ48157.1 hypothetical protein BXY45_13237 [Quadrisphaera granulorum]SZE98526.1 hypothetical protein SAMN06264364_13237 [Quadrisphaera granulorum]
MALSEHSPYDDRSTLEHVRHQHDERVERTALEATQRRRAAVEVWRRERDAEDGRRQADQQEQLAARRMRDEQVRQRHLAEDEERRAKKLLDDALRRERVTAHLARQDPARHEHLARAQADVERATQRWQAADALRRQWPSRWPW